MKCHGLIRILQRIILLMLTLMLSVQILLRLPCNNKIILKEHCFVYTLY